MFRFIFNTNFQLFNILFIVFSSLTIANPVPGNEQFTNYNSRLLEKIVSSHPEILAYEENARSIYYSKETVDVLPDTKIAFSYRSYPVRGSNPLRPDLTNREDTPGMTGREISLIQEIPYLDRLRSEKKILYWDYRTDKQRVQIKKNEFLSNLFILLVEAKILEKEKKDWKEIQKISKSVYRISQAGFSTGSGSSFSTLRDKNDSITVQDKILEIETKQKEVDKALFYYTYNLSTEEIKILVEEVDLILDKKWINLVSEIEKDSLNLAKNNPNTKILESSWELAKEKENRDNLQYYPDAELFLSYLRRNSRLYRISENPINYGSIMPNQEFSGDLVSFGVTLRIPTWSWAIKNDLNKKNHSLKNKELQSLQALMIKINTEIQRLSEKIQGTAKRLIYYENELLPSLKRSGRISSAGINQTNETNSTLRLRMEYLIYKTEKSNLEREKYISIIQLLEWVDGFRMNPKDDFESIDKNFYKERPKLSKPSQGGNP